MSINQTDREIAVNTQQSHHGQPTTYGKILAENTTKSREIRLDKSTREGFYEHNKSGGKEISRIHLQVHSDEKR